MHQMPLRIGLLGCGTIAQFAHLPALERAVGVEMKAICDGREDLLNAIGARFAGTRLYTDCGEFLQDDGIDAVLIAVPDVLHVPLATQALRAGKHVLVEKPLGSNSSECERLCELVETTNLTLQVGSMKRHDPGIAFAAEFIRARLGEILSVSAWYRDSLFRGEMQKAILPMVIGSNSTTSSVADAKTSDRRHYSLVTHGAHLFDTIRYLSGEVINVSACLAEKFNQYSWHGMFQLESGAAGNFELSVKVNGDFEEGYTVQGTHGSVAIRTFLPFYCRSSEVRAFDGRTQEWHVPLGANSNPYKNQLEAFAQSVLKGKAANPNEMDGLAAVRLLEAVEESAASGNRINLMPSKIEAV
jgi:predicted dehydrogenase